ncbi:CPBP family intramembrane metalloprotease [Ruminococcus sp. HUN007]|uniref:CPBP family intramembrane metalloprotease n=1 Tax=Ruminococcus sp. HUN007 TaxID=1514668 RepID=UPI0005D27765|nr:CPBP family intramembrane metalloprotease [Ruminococcus sp. HUN007]
MKKIRKALVFTLCLLPVAAVGSWFTAQMTRCFLMNGAFGIVFGRLYHKYGIQYAMIAHMLIVL